MNENKSKVMIFNFNDDKFATRLYIGDTLLETVTKTKLLGTMIQSNLKWNSNTDMLVKKGYQRMIILHKLYEFNICDSDMVKIYVIYLRSILEQSCAVWHHSITEEQVTDLERVQKTALKIIIKERYETYDQALQLLKLETLDNRREQLCLNFERNVARLKKPEPCSLSTKTPSRTIANVKKSLLYSMLKLQIQD